MKREQLLTCTPEGGDPIGSDGGINLYAYCGNGPVGAVDPEGTDIFGIPDATVAGGVVTAAFLACGGPVGWAMAGGIAVGALVDYYTDANGDPMTAIGKVLPARMEPPIWQLDASQRHGGVPKVTER